MSKRGLWPGCNGESTRAGIIAGPRCIEMDSMALDGHFTSSIRFVSVSTPASTWHK